MRVYLDNCSLQRPFDNQNQPRIALEAEAVTKIISLCETGQLSLVTSTALDIEIDQTPNETRRALTRKTLLVAKESIKLTEQVKARAIELETHGLKPFDATHLACAEIAKADYFCTCDDKFLKKATAIINLVAKVVSPVQLLGSLYDTEN